MSTKPISQPLTVAGIPIPNDRTTLRPDEIAKMLECTKEHVLNLVEEGELVGVNIAGIKRAHWRVSVHAFAEFLRRRSSIVNPA